AGANSDNTCRNVEALSGDTHQKGKYESMRLYGDTLFPMRSISGTMLQKNVLLGSSIWNSERTFKWH
ncbi:10360_t:CDS:1, partial [Cetraspora pellucida]